MTLLNIKIKEKEKDRIKEIIKKSDYKSISEFVREAIDEKLRIEENKNEFHEITIPDWIPDGKYYAIVKGAIVGVGDAPSSLAREVVAKFPFEYVIMKRKNKDFPKLEYVYSAESVDLKCWKYFEADEKSYPILPITLIKADKRETLNAIPDTAASLTLMKSEIVDELALEKVGVEAIQTASGISDRPIHKCNIELLSQTFTIRIISSPISDLLPFQCLIGRNLLDLFDLYLLGKKQIICIK